MSGRRNSKGTKKNSDEDAFIPELGNDDYEDQIIQELEEDINNNNNNKRKRSSSGKLNIRDFTDNEANEETPKRKNPKQQAKQPEPETQSTKPQEMKITETVAKIKKPSKIWLPSEAALLKILMTGGPPIGRNVAGMSFSYSLSLSCRCFLTQKALTASLNRFLAESDSSHHVFTTKEVKNKLETNPFLNISVNQAILKPFVPQKSTPLFDNRMFHCHRYLFFVLFYLIIFLFYLSDTHLLAVPSLYSKYETPHIIDTDCGNQILCWPKADGRDAKVSIKDNYLSVEVQLSPLSYVFMSRFFEKILN